MFHRRWRSDREGGSLGQHLSAAVVGGGGGGGSGGDGGLFSLFFFFFFFFKDFFFFFFCVPQLYLWGSPLLGEIFAYVTVF